MEKLQRRIENIEKSIRKLGGGVRQREDKLWSTVIGTNTKVEEVIQKSLKDRDIEKRKTKQKEEYNSFWTPRVRQS